MLRRVRRSEQPKNQLFVIPYEGNESTRAARRKIDKEIAELERKIQSLRTKRNELSSISVLSPEVLSSIFIFVRDPPTEFQWIRIGQVCHHWREVVLSCPILWSAPIFSRPYLAREMIQRSKMAPLTIRWCEGIWTPELFKQMKNALAQAHRVRSIEVMLDDPSKLNIIYSLLSQQAPLLEDISLSTHPQTMYIKELFFPQNAIVDAPRLQRVDFNRLDFSWESAIFKHSNLTDLRLRNSHAAVHGGNSTIGQMMDALHHLPNLRILKLKDSIPSHASSSGNEKTLQFKFLEQLRLGARVAECIFLLRHIQYPASTVVKLHSSSNGVEDSTTLFSLLNQQIRCTQSAETGIPHSPIIIRSARLTSSESATEIAFFNEANVTKCLSLLSGDYDPILRIRLDYDCDFDAVLTGINTFDLASLEGLLLGWSFTKDHIRTIQKAFGTLPKLSIISVTESLPEVCLALKKKPKENQAYFKTQHTLPPITIFPALRTLKVECNMELEPCHSTEFMESLMDMLIKRSNIGVPIDNVVLQLCHRVRTWQKRQLGELVVNLKVNGEVIDMTKLETNGRMESDDDENESEDSNESFPYW